MQDIFLFILLNKSILKNNEKEIKENKILFKLMLNINYYSIKYLIILLSFLLN